MAKTFNPFDALLVEEKTVEIENFGSIKIRDLTVGESDAFNKRLLKDYDGKGDPKIDLAEATLINYEKIALAMIEPKTTVKQLQSLGSSKAAKVIQDIVKAIDGKDEDAVDAEGNLED